MLVPRGNDSFSALALMATNPFPVCGSACSRWRYNFTYVLAWSNNCEVADVLSDIPFISVGILVFGVSILFFVFRRVPLSAIWLYLSALLALVAMILDLGHTIANELAIGTTSSTAWRLIRAREVLLALSIGFRFLFYWTYAAEPPRKALPSTPPIRASGSNFLALDSSDEPHGGTWIRWGIPGVLLRLGLLAAIVVITVLQVVWRVVPQYRRYSNTYATDAALELLVSFLLVLKLLMNTITPNTPDRVLVHTFRESLAPICGLLMNIAIGVGNLLCFAFTESTVGRLLQAVEVYTIVIFVVTIALLRYRNLLLSPAFPQRSKHEPSNFMLPDPARGSIFRVSPPLVETPRMSMILASATSNNVPTRETLCRSSRHSLNQVPSWMAGKVPRNCSGGDGEDARLWEQNNTEKGKVDPSYTGKADTELRDSLTSLTEEPKKWAELVHDADASHMSIMSALDAQSAIARSMENSSIIGEILSGSQTVLLHPRPKITPPASTVSPNTLILEDTGLGIVPKMEESPIYGLDGIRSVEDASNDSRTSLDELLRQQNELDQSIEALKLFSPRASTNSSYSSPLQSPGTAELSRFSSSSGCRTASDLSLSNFPIPPWLTTPMPSLPPSRMTSVLRTRGDRRLGMAATPVPQPLVNEVPSSPLAISPSPVDIPITPRSAGVPYSPLREDSDFLSSAAGRSPRVDSEGTQYNVTSFIGGLALPGVSVSGNTSGSIVRASSPARAESSVLAAQNSSSLGNVNHLQVTQASPPPEILPMPPPKAKFSRHAGYAGSLQGQNTMADPALLMQRRINQQNIPSLTITPSPPRSRLRISTTPAQDSVLELPTKPTREIDSDDGNAEGTSDRPRRVFERRRPRSLILQSYSDHLLHAPRAQDAGG